MSVECIDVVTIGARSISEQQLFIDVRNHGYARRGDWKGDVSWEFRCAKNAEDIFPCFSEKNSANYKRFANVSPVSKTFVICGIFCPKSKERCPRRSVPVTEYRDLASRPNFVSLVSVSKVTCLGLKALS